MWSFIRGILLLLAASFIAVMSCLRAQAADSKQNPSGIPVKLLSREFIPATGMSAQLPSYAALHPELTTIHVLIQFQNIPTESEKRELEKSGITLLTYIPENCFLASVDKARLSKVSSISNVRALLTLLVTDKIHPKVLEQGVGSWAKTKDNKAVIVVLFYKDVSLSEAKDIISAYNGQVIGEIKTVNGLQIAVDENKIRGLAANDKVLWIEESLPIPESQNDYSRLAVDVDFSNTTGLHGNPYTTNNDYDLTGQGIKIMLRETGGHPGPHPDYSSRLQLIESFVINDHPTHIAGILIGNGTKSMEKGATINYQWRGMAPNANLLAYIEPTGPSSDPTQEDYWFHYQDMENDFNDAISRGAKISSNSYGINIGNGVTEDYPPGTCHFYGEYGTATSILDNLSHDNYISIVKSAGNQRVIRNFYNTCGPDDYNTTTPFTGAKNLISVGAINSVDNSITVYSSYGPVDDGRIKPELVAPGQRTPNYSIWSTWVNSTNTSEYGYRWMGGTSMATPVIAGSEALLLEQLNNQGIITTVASTLKAILVHTAKDLDRTGNGVVSNDGPDYANGYGLIDVRKAIDLIKSDTIPPHDFIIEDEVDQGGTKGYYMMVQSEDTLTATLVWDDYPGVPIASKNLVNDLDLLLDSPDPFVHLPWKLDPSNPSAPAGFGVDSLNNIEQVRVVSPVNGLWYVRIDGRTVPQGPQKYSLVLSTSRYCEAKPGDANSDNNHTLADIISTVNYIFNKQGCSPLPSCWLSQQLCRGDWDGSGTVSLSDVIRGVNYIFNKPGGPWSPQPIGLCCQVVP